MGSFDMSGLNAPSHSLTPPPHTHTSSTDQCLIREELPWGSTGSKLKICIDEIHGKRWKVPRDCQDAPALTPTQVVEKVPFPAPAEPSFQYSSGIRNQPIAYSLSHKTRRKGIKSMHWLIGLCPPPYVGHISG